MRQRLDQRSKQKHKIFFIFQFKNQGSNFLDISVE